MSIPDGMRADQIIPDKDLYEFATRMVCPRCGGGHYTIVVPPIKGVPGTNRSLVERRCPFCQAVVSKPNPYVKPAAREDRVVKKRIERIERKSAVWVKHEGMYPKLTAEQKRIKRGEDKLRINRFKKRKERQLAKTSKKLAKGVSWKDEVCVLTGTLSMAIWREGGLREDALATAEIVYHAICRDLHNLFDREGKILPFKRNKDYFKKVRDG